MDDQGTHLYLARVDGQVVGSLSLVVMSIPTGTKVGFHNFNQIHESLIPSKISLNLNYQGSDRGSGGRQRCSGKGDRQIPGAACT